MNSNVTSILYVSTITFKDNGVVVVIPLKENTHEVTYVKDGKKTNITIDSAFQRKLIFMQLCAALTGDMVELAEGVELLPGDVDHLLAALENTRLYID